MATLATTATTIPFSIERALPYVEGNPIKNQLLLDLPARECALIYPNLTFVNLRVHEVLQECEEEVKYAYFLESGVVSVLNLCDDGRCVEVGISGKEGCTAPQLAAGLKTSLSRIVVQIGGTAFRIASPRLATILPQCPRLQSRIQQYSHLMAMQSAQIACCNLLHEIDERLARWLLMSQDRIHNDVIPLTHESIAHMLGIRRASVSVAAGVLQQAGVISYTRGAIKIADRRRLEKVACDCYRLMRRHTDVWKREAT